MVQNVNPTFVKTPNLQVTLFTTTLGASGAFQTVYTGGVSGSKIVGISITGTATATQDIRFAVTSSLVNVYINTVSIAQSAGNVSSVAPANGFLNSPLPVDSDGNPYLILPSTGFLLSAQITTNSSTWSSGLAIGVAVTAGDF